MIIKGKKPNVVHSIRIDDSWLPYILIESFGGVYRQFTDDSSCKLAYQDDVLLVWDGERAGLSSQGHFGYIGSTIAAVRVRDEHLHPEYLFRIFEKEREWLRNNSEGTGVPHLSKWAVESISYFRPRLPEQREIATILSSVDDVIEKTRTQIDKLKDLKTGMMQELLTKGIGHTEFKDSPLGRVPKDWRVVTVESLLAKTRYPMRSGPFGSALRKHELVNEGVPYLGIDNVHTEEFRASFKRFVSREKFEELKRYTVFPKDVMVTIMGTVGRSCVVPVEMREALSSKHVWTLTLDLEKYLPELLCWQINYADWVKQQFQNDSRGGVMESISSSTLKTLLVPAPLLMEQKKISQTHSTLSRSILAKEKKLASLENLKKALMQDLLTGKVRVSIDSQEVAVA